MLRKLSIENFYSIKNKVELDFQIPNTTPPDQRFGLIPEISKYRVPKVISIFGANASGKTTILRAIQFVRWFIRDSFNQPPSNNLVLMPFGSDETQSQPTIFEAVFDSDLIPGSSPCIYKYRLEIDNNPRTRLNSNFSLSKIVKSESLYYYPLGKPRRLFSREYDEIKGSDEFKINSKSYPPKTFRENVSVLPTLAQFAHEEALELVTRFETVQTNNTLLQKYDFDVNFMSDYYANNLHVLEKLNDKIKILDLGINNVVLRNEGGKASAPFFQHAGLNRELPLIAESSGTQKFFSIFPVINYVLESGGIAVLDEIDNDIHPMIIPEILSWFYDPVTNPQNAQLIMACHNASILEYLEKEEIYFTEKSSTGETQSFCLKQIEGVRRIDNYYKKYLDGFYGAIPKIG